MFGWLNLKQTPFTKILSVIFITKPTHINVDRSPKLVRSHNGYQREVTNRVSQIWWMRFSYLYYNADNINKNIYILKSDSIIFDRRN